MDSSFAFEKFGFIREDFHEDFFEKENIEDECSEDDLDESPKNKNIVFIGKNNKNNIVTNYLSTIGKNKLLSAAEEIELSKKFHEEGDINAKKILIISNLRLVVSIAKKFVN